MDVRTAVATNGGSWATQFAPIWAKQLEHLKQKYASAILRTWMPPADPTDVPVVFVERARIVEILSYVKEAAGFEYQFLADLTAIDEGVESKPRFEMVYQLFSHTQKCRIRFKVPVADGEEVPTLSAVWPGANWAEREVFDMFGIRFSGHPDLRRILMDERWVGHPLRKDYPLRGYQIFTEPMVPREELLK